MTALIARFRASILATLLVFGMASAGVGALAGGASAATGPKYGGTVTTGGTPVTDMSWLAAGYNVGSNLQLSLITGVLFLPPARADEPYIPQLATGYSFNAKRTVLTIQLRHGVKFSDGTPFTSAALVWLWSPAIDLNPVSKAYTYLTLVTSVKAKGKYTVVVDFSAADSIFIASLANEPDGLIGSPTAYNMGGETQFDQFPVGAGPYKVTAHVPNELITLTKNPSYFDAKDVYLQTITQIFTGSDPTANYDDLVSGQIDTYGLSGISTPAPIIFQGLTNANFSHSISPTVSYAFMDFTNSAPFWNAGPNAQNGMLAREAIDYCTDRAPIAGTTLEGYAQPAYIFASPSEDFYPTGANGKPSVAAAQKYLPYQYDVAKGTAIVQQLGGLSFTLTVLPGLPPLATALLQEWAQCGIKATTFLVSVAQETAVLQLGQYQAYLTDTGGVPDFRLFSKYVTPQEPLDQQGEQPDAVIINAFNKSLRDTSPIALQTDFSTIWRQLAKDAELIPVISATGYTLLNKCFHNVAYGFGASLSWLHAYDSC